MVCNDCAGQGFLFKESPDEGVLGSSSSLGFCRRSPLFNDLGEYVEYVVSNSCLSVKFFNSLNVESRGRTVSYRISSVAKCSDERILARYEDSSQRRVSVDVGDRFDEGEELRDFGDEIVEAIRGRFEAEFDGDSDLVLIRQ